MKLSDAATAAVRFGRERRARAADERLLREAEIGGQVLLLWERIARIEAALGAETWDWEEGT